MQSKVTEIAQGTFRISTFHPDYGIQFNQFLIKDDEPFLMHTGFKRMFPATLEGVASIIDPSTVRWLGFSHFESDECGALNEWLEVAPRAQAVCSFVSAMVNVIDFADRAPRALAEGEVLQTGRHRLRFLSTPHVPHAWDAGLAVGAAFPGARNLYPRNSPAEALRSVSLDTVPPLAKYQFHCFRKFCDL